MEKVAQGSAGGGTSKPTAQGRDGPAAAAVDAVEVGMASKPPKRSQAAADRGTSPRVRRDANRGALSSPGKGPPRSMAAERLDRLLV